MKKIKVLHIIWSMGAGGAQQIVLNYLRDLHDDPDIDMILCVYTGKTDSKYDKEIEEKKYNVVYLDNPKTRIQIPYIRRFFQHYVAKKEWEKAIRSLSPDVIHVHISGLLRDALHAVDLLNIPLRFDTLHSDPRRYKGQKLKCIKNAFINKGFIPLCVTKEQKTIASSHYGNFDYEIIPNGVDVEAIKKKMVKKENARKELGISHENFVVLAVGRINPIKNFSLLIDAFDLLIKKQPKGLLIFAGDGVSGEKKRLKDKINSYGLQNRVLFLGAVSNIVPLYCLADVLAVPSISESFSLVTLEAQICGLRCVISDGVPSEVIVTNAVRKMDYHDDASKWADALLDTGFKGNNVSNLKDFEVHSVSQKLKHLYLEKWKIYLDMKNAN